MLVIGVLFLLLGFLVIFSQKYTIKKVGNERNIEEKTLDQYNNINKYKNLLGIFSIILGIFCIINYIIY